MRRKCTPGAVIIPRWHILKFNSIKKKNELKLTIPLVGFSSLYLLTTKHTVRFPAISYSEPCLKKVY